MSALFATLSFMTCGFSAAIHLATFVGIDPMTTFPWLWVLHPLAMVAGISTMFSGMGALDLTHRKSFLDMLNDEPAPTPGSAGRADEAMGARDEGDLVRRLRPSRPAIVASLLAAYVAINFVASLALLGGGIPTERGALHVLTSHGKVLKSLSSSDYGWALAYQARLATGHWMFFFFLSGAVWSAKRTREKRSVTR